MVLTKGAQLRKNYLFREVTDNGPTRTLFLFLQLKLRPVGQNAVEAHSLLHLVEEQLSYIV
jgi:hypothetical protein